MAVEQVEKLTKGAWLATCETKHARVSATSAKMGCMNGPSQELTGVKGPVTFSNMRLLPTVRKWESVGWQLSYQIQTVAKLTQ